VWPFRNIRKWKRANFDPPPDAAQQMRRKEVEKITDHDLQKPIQQFLCDVHEEANRPPCEKSTNQQLTYAEDRILDAIDKLSCENKRMVALQTVTAFSSARMTKWIIALTLMLVLLTIFLVVDTVYKYVSSDTPGQSTQEQKIRDTLNKNAERSNAKQS